MNLYYLNFNNYYNRTIKRYDQPASYLTPENIVHVEYNVYNFPFGDDVNTEVVVNRWPQGVGADYMLAMNPDNTINSRWFVIDAFYTRNGQYKMTLRRDLVADHYAEIVNAPMFVEKATPININDPAIFNSEDMTFNQIKQSEVLLKDKSNCAWVVGYIPQDKVPATEITSTVPTTGTEDIVVANLSDYQYYQYALNPAKAINFIRYGVHVAHVLYTPIAEYNKIVFGFNNQGNYIEPIKLSGTSADYDSGYTTRGILDEAYPHDINNAGIAMGQRIANSYASVINSINSAAAQELEVISPATQVDIYNENGKILLDQSTGLYYRISVIVEGTIPLALNVTSSMPLLFGLLRDNMNTQDISGTPDDSTFILSGQANSVKVVFNQLTENIKTTLSSTASRYHVEDSPYDIFAIPYALDTPITIYNGTDVYIQEANANAAIQIATAISATLGDGAIYDLQLLPYCPVRYALQDDGTLNLAGLFYNTVYGSGQTPINVIFWARKSWETFDIPVNLPGANSVIDKKVNSETNLYRLCSPNYASASDFSVEMNNGVEFVNVDFNYKPFNPYIHLNINYKGLYGSDFNDTRGLILQGDFSLPQTSSAWANYELNNKNYLNSFNRQIESLELQNKYQKVGDIVGAITGTFTGGISGATTGALVGGVPGAIVGGVVGAGASVAGGIADISINEKLRNDALDLTRDQFGYQLGNIQAIPNSIAKTSAITLNNKYFPFIEYYTCTDIEKQALRDKITYNGMTIMRIGSIGQFLNTTPTYIKGRLIRVESGVENFHQLKEIANELNKGVFI